MNRSISLLFAVLLTFISLSSVGFATELDRLRFDLKPDGGDRLQFSLTDDRSGDGRFISSSVVSALTGLDRSAMASASPRPVTFALLREAGRLDCAGTARSGAASGSCRFTPDRGFADFLSARGIARPTQREAFGLTTVGASRALVEAIAAARYPAPSIGDLTGLAALGVTRAYLADLSSRGYRPARTSDLIAFKALGVTPDYVDGLRRAGFAHLSADDIVQFKALGVTPAYLASLRSVGYARLSAGEIVQLKALDVTADYIAGFQRLGYRLPVSKLVQSKAMGVTPADLRSLGSGTEVSISAEELIRLKVAGLLP